MDFTRRKLPIEATSELRLCPVDTIQPFALMIAPVYVLLRRNQKYVSVKAPLDFFTPDELDHLRSFESFFVPLFVDQALPYRELARRVKRLLSWNPPEGAMATLPPAPFELADALLRVTAPLWGGGHGIESFFVTVFSNEFCALLPGEELKAARDRNLPGFERAVALSAWMVFLFLHLGIADLNYLNGLRLSSFRKALGTEPVLSRIEEHSEAGELYRVLDDLLAQSDESLAQGALEARFTLATFEARSERVAQKIAGRIRRIEAELLGGTRPLTATIRGKAGFVDE